MRDVEIPIPTKVDGAKAAVAIDKAIARLGLNITMRGSLKKHPGCTHWHLKKGRESGTLEVTLWPQERRAWITVHDGRTGAWIDAEIKRLAEVIGHALKKT